METATFAAGCFWGVEAGFAALPGVLSTEVGYTGGHTPSPTYEQTCTGQTGHAEAVRLTYDPAVIQYEELLDFFWQCHDPTTLNRQGPDIGSQYRSAIFTHTPEQNTLANAARAALEASGKHPRPVVTDIAPAGAWTAAEDYHQQYFAKRGLSHGACHL
ncbi:MAG: peptide-methionine (S)-S-oxide reductase MsrA [Candidatus Melainabacteria bacterium]